MRRLPLGSGMILLILAVLLPLTDLFLPDSLKFAPLLRPIFIFAILGLGLNVVTGYTGLLNLGVAAFMAIGAYVFSILTCDIYPFQFGFFSALFGSLIFGSLSGVLLGLPTLRLRGDYLAIVTLGFGEIVQDCLKNVESITKGTQGINPLPAPNLLGYQFTAERYLPWYYLLLALLTLVALVLRNLERSRVGRAWISIREDELASTCMGIDAVHTKLLAFALGAGICAMAGALWAAHLGSSGEPGNYDFQVSMIALCAVIVGGLGSINGVLLGAFIMVGLNSIVLVKLSGFLMSIGLSSTNVFSSPNNWKYIVFGLALIITMRLKPNGLIPERLGLASDSDSEV